MYYIIELVRISGKYKFIRIDLIRPINSTPHRQYQNQAVKYRLRNSNQDNLVTAVCACGNRSGSTGIQCICCSPPVTRGRTDNRPVYLCSLQLFCYSAWMQAESLPNRPKASIIARTCRPINFGLTVALIMLLLTLAYLTLHAVHCRDAWSSMHRFVFSL
jgi:hypothetical protein